MLDPESELDSRRSEPRRFVGLIVITAAVALALGVIAEAAVDDGQPTISRAGAPSGACSSAGRTSSTSAPGWSIPRTRSIAPPRCENAGSEPVKHYYSSKPALLSTLIAGVLYPARRLTGIPIDRVVLQEREERWVQKNRRERPGQGEGCPGETERRGEVVGPRLLFQGGPAAPEHPAVLRSS